MGSSSLWDSLDAIADAPLHASEALRAQAPVPAVRMSYRQWAERFAAQPALVTARELAGLPDERLAALAAEHQNAPNAPRALWLTGAAAAAVVAVLVGAVLGTVHESGDRALTALALGLMLVGVSGSVLVGWLFFSQSNEVQARRRLALLVSPLDEQHPWLYRTLLLLKHAPAQDYRVRTLTHRGALRGVDYLLMHEIAQVHARLETTRTASAVVAMLQSLPGSPEPATAAGGPARAGSPDTVHAAGGQEAPATLEAVPARPALAPVAA